MKQEVRELLGTRLNEHGKVLNERETRAVRLRLEGKKFSEIGKEMSVGSARASQVFHRARRKLDSEYGRVEELNSAPLPNDTQPMQEAV
jgi:DNA-directed RNA polymerase specialized sigma subunit